MLKRESTERGKRDEQMWKVRRKSGNRQKMYCKEEIAR
jgi:hypothetical protein